MSNIQAYIYDAELVRVVDGDTVRFRLFKVFEYTVDFGFYIKETIRSTKHTEMNFRLFGINTPEIRGVSAEVKAKGMAAKAEVERLLSLGSLRVETYKPDKYGRWLASVWVYPANDDPINVNEWLVEHGHAERYMV